MAYDLIIIGSGPAGYVAAIRAGQTGLKTLVIDKKYIGGMYLNWGCIPTKSLLESAKAMRKVKQ
ncbi:MAG TPA: FAD-dependent oxidoreductase, partial [Candidatus Cloacimonadota bacterium]|nr:FAD-dependent oxidoreductase [Candidatus Cloacimonadota bacterium]